MSNLFLSDGKVCCGKFNPTSTLTCEDKTWIEMISDTICDIEGPNAKCPNEPDCPENKPAVNSTCEADKSPEKCEYGQ